MKCPSITRFAYAGVSPNHPALSWPLVSQPAAGGYRYNSAGVPSNTPDPLWPLVSQLGEGFRFESGTGNVLMNMPRIEFLAKQGERVLPALGRFLQTATAVPPILEALYLAQRLVENKTPGVKTLYGPASRFNNTNDPYIQVYLAGFYRKLDEPATFGPLLAMFYRRMSQPAYPTPFDPLEEIGGSILQQVSEHTAHEVRRHLQASSKPMG